MHVTAASDWSACKSSDQSHPLPAPIPVVFFLARDKLPQPHNSSDDRGHHSVAVGQEATGTYLIPGG